MEKLKREFLDLLEKDLEFRYTVAGYLGLSEILKRLDRLEEGQTKLWEEVKSLREGQEKLWENQSKLWEEVKALRVEHEKIRKYMISGFRDLKRTLMVAFEDHAASFLEIMLEEIGYPEARVEKKYLAYQGQVIDINLFCEDPLAIGEATTTVKNIEEGKDEVDKLLKRVKIVEEEYGRKPMLIVLSIARTTPEIAETLKKLTERHGVKLILGREIEEALSI
ncbi:hypothetical protein KEJ27_08745 [Candidatus Bathyarchaeota archaeon]|nr:hypothetical protein [Candidatus Bathyarchaeota archaeon]MBS7617785.1 hypothetical protein [Candidatus Bathyarchaeota archaeon]